MIRNQNRAKWVPGAECLLREHLSIVISCEMFRKEKFFRGAKKINHNDPEHTDGV